MDATIGLPLLELFVTVADTGSFSAAAARLGTSKSSVSRGVAQLESQIGAQLVHRTTRRVALSTAGSALYQRSAPLLGALRHALGSVPEREAEPSGELRITAPNDFGAIFLSEMLPAFVRRHPAVRVDVRLSNRHVDLIAEGYDLALRALGRMNDSSLIVRRLDDVEIQLFAAPSYLARRGLPRTPAEAAGHDWVLFRDSWPGREFGVLGRARLVGDDFAFIRAALRAGGGIGPLPTFLAHADVQAGALVRVLPRHSAPGRRKFVLLYPRARHVPRKVLAFRDFLLQTLAARPLAPGGRAGAAQSG